jgi:hypothetical protein
VTSKKTYQRITDILAGEYKTYQGNQDVEIVVENITASVADVFAQENNLFNRTMFYRASLGRSTVRPIELCEYCREAYKPRDGHECSFENGSTAATRFKFSGSISTGTMLPHDLIAAFDPVLQELDRKKWSELVMARPSDDQEYVVQIMDALDDCAPEGLYFGAHPGDGSDYGFWENDPGDDQ